jgi:hypothetical protein
LTIVGVPCLRWLSNRLPLLTKPVRIADTALVWTSNAISNPPDWIRNITFQLIRDNLLDVCNISRAVQILSSEMKRGHRRPSICLSVSVQAV